jgi:ubiquinol-cytochrome c reductase cytochrome c subunit
VSRLALGVSVLALAAVPATRAATGPPPVGIVRASTGAALYAANCSSCHGPHGAGIAAPGRPGVGDLVGEGPSLLHAGAGTVDFYLSTGYMPLANPHLQPWQSPVLFSARQVRELVAYVAAFGHGAPIPHPDPASGSLARGFQLFTEHCSGCHQVAGEGGYLTGARVPALTGVTDVEVAEAVRAGPYVMPSFSPRAISNAQLNSIIRYLDYARHPQDPGGWSIGRIGPVPEGLVAWLVGAALLVAFCRVVGKRARYER